MRGPDEQTQHMFSYLLPEQRVPADHPLRAIRVLTDDALRSMSAQFEGLSFRVPMRLRLVRARKGQGACRKGLRI